MTPKLHERTHTHTLDHTYTHAYTHSFFDYVENADAGTSSVPRRSLPRSEGSEPAVQPAAPECGS